MAKAFGELASKIGEAAGQEQSTRQSNTLDHKRAFLRHYKRWAAMFRGKDTGSIESEKWLIAEYYQSLSHLSEAGFEALTERLKETCTFFPSIRECLDLTKPKDRYDWGHPFLNKPHMFASSPSRQALAATAQPMLTNETDD